MLVSLFAAWAQVTPTGPFTGGISEDFDGFPQTTAAPQCHDDVFTPGARVCAPLANVGGVQIRPSLFLGCLLEARSAPHLAGSNDGPAEFELGAVTRFGGWFATHASDGDLTITLYDAAGAVLLEDTQPLGGACTWAWRGYQSAGAPIARVRVRHSQGNGALIDFDDLQADLACGPSDLDCDGSPAGVDCDDLDARRTPGAPEACDGVDNDCDGVVPANESDADGDGWRACEECDDGDDGVYPGAVDDCDGVDNDCDGVVGNSPPQVPAADRQSGVCAGAVKVCDGVGWVEPDYGARPGWEAVETTCDGLDNDCDGAVDADLTPPATAILPGVCAVLAPTCAGEAGWVTPDPSTLPGWQAIETRCDGLDNDCDGTTDEGDEHPAELQDGVCAGAEQVCLDGQWLEPVYADLPDFDPVERCDGLDNDCNGLVDDACVEPEMPLCGCASARPSGLWLAFAGLLGLRRRVTRT